MPFNNRFQDITLWGQNGVGDDGFPAVDAPITFKGRWEDRIAELSTPAFGQTKTSNARIWFGEDVVLEQGDYVYEGVSVDVTPPSNARRVIRVVKIPSVRNDKVERFAYLD